MECSWKIYLFLSCSRSALPCPQGGQRFSAEWILELSSAGLFGFASCFTFMVFQGQLVKMPKNFESASLHHNSAYVSPFAEEQAFYLKNYIGWFGPTVDATASRWSCHHGHFLISRARICKWPPDKVIQSIAEPALMSEPTGCWCPPCETLS